MCVCVCVCICMHCLTVYACDTLYPPTLLRISVFETWPLTESEHTKGLDWLTSKPQGSSHLYPLSSRQQAYKRIPLCQFFMWVEGIRTRVAMFVCATSALPTEPSRQLPDSFKEFIPHVRTCHNIKTLVGPKRVRGCVVLSSIISQTLAAFSPFCPY